MTLEKAQQIYITEYRLRRISEYLLNFEKDTFDWLDIKLINEYLGTNDDEIFKQVKENYRTLLTSMKDKIQKEFDEL